MGVSLKPSEAVAGGVVPQDVFLTVKEARFNIFAYMKKDGTPALGRDGQPARTVAMRLKTVSDEGTEFEQEYSIGDPKEFAPSEDNENASPNDEGKYLVSIGQRTAISNSCNFFLYTSNLVNAGFPENKLGDDISVLEGLEAFHIAIPEPKRSGLARPVVEGARERIISVPSQIRKLPWDKVAKKGAAAPVAGKPGAKAPIGPSAEIVEAAVAYVTKQIEAADDSTVTRADLAQTMYSDKAFAKNPNRDAIAKAIFTKAVETALTEAGFTVDGETISKE
jgi:hypothetical protein